MVKLRNTNSIIILIEITQLESENVHRFDLTKYRSTKIANGKCFTQEELRLALNFELKIKSLLIFIYKQYLYF